jgi:membrane protein
VNKDNFKSAKSLFDLSISSWWRIAKRVFGNIQDHNVPLIAAGTAFYFLLAIFPLLAATISLYGLVVSQQELQEHMVLLVDLVPSKSRYIIEEQLTSLTQKSSATLGWGFVFTLLLSLWSSSKGGNALIKACNITYIEPEGRSFFHGLIARVVCTLGMIFMLLIALFSVSLLPELISALTHYSLDKKDARWITWPLLLLLFNLSLSLLYRYAPHRRPARWRWITPGSCVATLLWVLASSAFSFYLNEFASYDKTYGSVGGLIILLMWLYLSAYIVLIGAELNAAMELQTTADSTVGEDKPMGERNAVVADNTPDDLR